MTFAQRKTIYGALGRHPVHPFPARMAPEIAFKILSKAQSPIRVLDPMMGSGTVLALARASGHRAVGVDIDPLSVLIAKVWTRAVDQTIAEKKASQVLSRARHLFKHLKSGDAYPANADKNTRRFIRYWFDDYARRQLAALATSIRGIRDEAMRDILWCAFSRLIITKQAGASLALDLAHSRPHKWFDRAPVKPFNGFPAAVSRVLENCISHESKSRGPSPCVQTGDARNLRLADASIDLVLTSPPYVNAIDYMRCSKFSLVWMGYSTDTLRNVRRVSVGTEVSTNKVGQLSAKIINELNLTKRLSNRHKGVLANFIDDMRIAVGEVSRVLVPGGKAVYVVGENTIRGTYVSNSKIIAAIARDAGLSLQSQTHRKLPPNRRYLPPPSNRKAPLDTRMRREVILAFRKPRRRKLLRRR